MELREVTYLAVALRIAVAVIIGGLIGLERGLKNRPAGLRTYMVVCVGACLVMLTNQYIYQVFGAGDPVRMGAQVVSGIGFLGAGTIIVTRRSQIKGLTTAAGLWAAAGVGLALGVGFYEAAITGGLAIFVVMTLLQRIDNSMHRKSKTVEAYIEVEGSLRLGQLLETLRAGELDVRDIQRDFDEEEKRAYIATLRASDRRSHVEIMEQLRGIEGVSYAEEL